MFRLAFRQRTGLLVTALLCGLLALFYAGSFTQAAGTTPAQRALFGQQMQTIGRQIAYLFPLPHRVDTLSGYMLWRSYGLFVLVFAFWGVLAAAGAMRGEEDAGLVEQWLSAGAPRARLLLTRFVAFAISAAAAVVVTGVGAVLGSLTGPDRLDTGGLLAVSAALWALTLAAYGITLLIAQQASNFRSAAGVGGAVVVAMMLLDGAFRTAGAHSWIQALSIFNLYNRTDALAPGGEFDWPSTLALLAVASATTGLGAWAFLRRDLNRALVPRPPAEHPPLHTAAANPLLRIPASASLWEQRVSLSLWIAGIFVFGLIETSAIKSAADLIEHNDVFRQYLQGQGGDPVVVLLGLAWFSLAALILAVFAIVQVAGWASEDGAGRLELVLAQPVQRWRVVLDRALSLLIAAALIAAAGSLAVWLAARSSGVSVPLDRLLLATALLLPFALTFAAIGAVLAGWRPRLAAGVLAAVALLSYLLEQLGPFFHWPDQVVNLSLFKLYGTPLSTPVFIEGLYGMIAVTVVGFGLAMLFMQRRDVGS